jgi:hypothetical protein
MMEKEREGRLILQEGFDALTPQGILFNRACIEWKDESSETSLCDAYNLPQNLNTVGHIWLLAFGCLGIEKLWG